MLNRQPQRYKQSAQFSRLFTRKPQCKVKKSMPHEFVKTAAQSFPTLMLQNYCRLTRLRISRLMWESCLPCPCELRYCPLLRRCVTLACRFSWRCNIQRGFILNVRTLNMFGGTLTYGWDFCLAVFYVREKQALVLQGYKRYNSS